MKKELSQRGLQKTFLFVFGIIFLIFSILLYNNQDDINRYSNITTILSFSQQNITKLQHDIDDLQAHIYNQDSESLTRYVNTNLKNHKEWLTKLLTGAEKNEPLAIFGTEYLSLLIKLQVDGEVVGSPIPRKLLRLLEDLSQPEANIVALSRQRVFTNLDQLNRSIILSNIIVLCLIFTFFTLLIFSYWRFSSQLKLAYKYQRLSLYFIDHPNVLLRLSLNSRIKYFNKQAEIFITQKKIDKYKLLPSNITSLVSQSIKCPEQVIYYNLEVAQHKMACEMRFCKQSQQIFIMMVESSETTTAEAEAASIEQVI